MSKIRTAALTTALLTILALYSIGYTHSQEIANIAENSQNKKIVFTRHTDGGLTDAAVRVALTSRGSGKNGPLTAQNGAFISAEKDGWYPGNRADAGEIDVLTLFGRQGGPIGQADMSGLLVNVQSAGGSFLSATEMLTSLVGPASSGAPIIKAIDIQDGILNTFDGSYIGRTYGAQVGGLGPAIQIGNSVGASWSDFLVGSVTNAVDGRPHTTVTSRITSDGFASFEGGIRTGIRNILSLPRCAAELEGTRAGVIDAKAPKVLMEVSPGGSVHVPVYCDGHRWVVG